MKRSRNKGSANINWKGGIAEYPNHYLMKKQRLIILMRNPKCERCEKPATEIHHKNKNKADHRLSNLMAVCHKCNCFFHRGPRKAYRTKYKRLYGMTFLELIELGKEKYNLRYWEIVRKLKGKDYPFNNYLRAKKAR